MHVKIATHLIARCDNRHLMIRRAGTSYYNGYLSLVAGHVENGEHADAALLREVGEETDLRLSREALDFMGVMDVLENHGRYVSYFFSTNINHTPNVREPDKISEIGWFDAYDDQVVKQTVPYIHQFLINPQAYIAFDVRTSAL